MQVASQIGDEMRALYNRRFREGWPEQAYSNCFGACCSGHVCACCLGPVFLTCRHVLASWASEGAWGEPWAPSCGICLPL